MGLIKKNSTITVNSKDLYRLAKESLDKCGRFSFVVRGYSMRPFIEDMDTVTLEKTDFDELRENDVVLCNINPGPVLHRVVRIENSANKYLLTVQADTEGAEQETVQSENVAGRVVAVRRNRLRRLKKNIKTKFRKPLFSRLQMAALKIMEK